MRLSTVIGVLLPVLLLVGLVCAQQMSRRGPSSALDISIEFVEGAVGYDPEIGTVQDGIVSDVRAIVSADRRYVQLDLRPTVSNIVAIDNFVVVAF